MVVEPDIILIAVTLIFDFFVVRLLWQAASLWKQILKYGKSYLRFNRFPFHLGETLDVELETSDRVRAAENITFTLRCVEEEMDRTENRVRLMQYEIYSDAITHSNGDTLEVSFPLPKSRKFRTRLSRKDRPRYWELEVRADKPCEDFETKFLVPVFAK